MTQESPRFSGGECQNKNIASAQSKPVLKSKLDNARRIDCLYRRTKAWTAKRADWDAEVRTVENIEKLCPEFKLPAFCELELLVYAHIQIDKSITSNGVASDKAILPEGEEVANLASRRYCYSARPVVFKKVQSVGRRRAVC